MTTNSIYFSDTPRAGRGLVDAAEWAARAQVLNNFRIADSMHGHIDQTPNGYAISPRTATQFYGTISSTDATKIDVGAFRQVDGYGYDDTIGVCTSSLSKTSSESVTISQDSYVYYEISLPDSAGDPFTATLRASATYPVADVDFIKPVLGKAFFSGGAIVRWVQTWLGPMTFDGSCADPADPPCNTVNIPCPCVPPCTSGGDEFTSSYKIVDYIDSLFPVTGSGCGCGTGADNPWDGVFIKFNDSCDWRIALGSLSPNLTLDGGTVIIPDLGGVNRIDTDWQIILFCPGTATPIWQGRKCFGATPEGRYDIFTGGGGTCVTVPESVEIVAIPEPPNNSSSSSSSQSSSSSLSSSSSSP